MWVRVDDGAPQHPKFLHAGREASWFWVCGNCYCNKYLTDGFIAEHALISLSPGAPHRRLASLLVTAKLWEKVLGGYHVHDFLDYNDSRVEALARQEATREQHRRAGIASGRSRRAKVNGPVERTTERPVQRESERPVEHLVERPVAPPLNPIPSHPIPSHPEKPELSEFSLGQNGHRRNHAPDEAWELFKSAYPAQRRQGGLMAQQRFLDACNRVGLQRLMDAIDLHKKSDQWKKGMVPKLENWLEKELWIQEPETQESGDELALKFLRENEAKRQQKP